MAMLTTRETGGVVSFAEPEAELDGEFEIRARGWIKRLLPRTMFGRSLLIVVAPLVLVQAIATWIFYDRHWAAVSWRLAAGVVGDIALVIEGIEHSRSTADITRLLDNAAVVTDLDFTLSRGERLPPPLASSGSQLEDQLVQAMKGRVDLPYRIDEAGDPHGTRNPGATGAGCAESRGSEQASVQPDDLHFRDVDGRLLAGVARRSHDLFAEPDQVCCAVWQPPPTGSARAVRFRSSRWRVRSKFARRRSPS